MVACQHMIVAAIAAAWQRVTSCMPLLTRCSVLTARLSAKICAWVHAPDAAGPGVPPMRRSFRNGP